MFDIGQIGIVITNANKGVISGVKCVIFRFRVTDDPKEKRQNGTFQASKNSRQINDVDTGDQYDDTYFDYNEYANANAKTANAYSFIIGSKAEFTIVQVRERPNSKTN